MTFKIDDIIVFSLGLTDRGVVRETNQDAFHIDTSENLFIVADGMGGHAGGEIASKLSISEIVSFLKNSEFYLSAQFTEKSGKNKLLSILSSAINHASSKIYEYALENPSLKGMGTTTTLMKIAANHAFCAHVGDSRLYLIRAGLIYQMTTDHSLVSEQIRAGIISEEEAQRHQLKNVITRSVGYQEEEEVDTFSFILEQNDLIILCSDGLHGKVTDKELSSLARKLETNAAKQLINLANFHGGEDNSTIIIVQIKELSKNADKLSTS